MKIYLFLFCFFPILTIAKPVSKLKPAGKDMAEIYFPQTMTEFWAYRMIAVSNVKPTKAAVLAYAAETKKEPFNLLAHCRVLFPLMGQAPCTDDQVKYAASTPDLLDFEVNTLKAINELADKNKGFHPYYPKTMHELQIANTLVHAEILPTHEAISTWMKRDDAISPESIDHKTWVKRASYEPELLKNPYMAALFNYLKSPRPMYIPRTMNEYFVFWSLDRNNEFPTKKKILAILDVYRNQPMDSNALCDAVLENLGTTSPCTEEHSSEMQAAEIARIIQFRIDVTREKRRQGLPNAEDNVFTPRTQLEYFAATAILQNGEIPSQESVTAVIARWDITPPENMPLSFWREVKRATRSPNRFFSSLYARYTSIKQPSQRGLSSLTSSRD